MKSKIALLAVLSVYFATIPLAAAASATEDAERELARLINEERTKQGLKPLEMDERLSEAARVHSQNMARLKQLSHQFPGEPKLQDRLARTGVPFDAVAENVAHSGSVGDAHEELMLSSGHRANILNPRYNAVGVGVVDVKGHLYITQAFAHKLPEYGGGEIEQSVLEAFNNLRKQNRLAVVGRARVSRLRDFACQQNITAQSALQRFDGADSAVVFTGSNPDELPSQMQRMAGEKWVSSMALGVCPPSNTHSSYAMFSVVALFYR